MPKHHTNDNYQISLRVNIHTFLFTAKNKRMPTHEESLSIHMEAIDEIISRYESNKFNLVPYEPSLIDLYKIKTDIATEMLLFSPNTSLS